MLPAEQCSRLRSSAQQSRPCWNPENKFWAACSLAEEKDLTAENSDQKTLVHSALSDTNRKKANDLEEFFNYLKAQKDHRWSPKGSCDTNNSVFPSRGPVQTSLYEAGYMRANGCVALPNTTAPHRTALPSGV